MSFPARPTPKRACLTRILMSADFKTSDRNRKFLEYVAEESVARYLQQMDSADRQEPSLANAPAS